MTLLEENRSDTIVATADLVTQIDDIQYSLGQGPCISRRSADHDVGLLGSDQRWPQSGSRVARWAHTAQVSLPLVTNAGAGRDERLRS